MSTQLRSLAAFLGGWLAATGALADTPPPIKPGLWQVNSRNEIDGKKLPDPGEQLANLPPEVRAKMQAMMKERGVAMDGSGGIKICHTRQTIDSGALRGDDTRCKTEFTSRTARSWKWHSECPAPTATVTDGEAVFDSPESYTMTQQSTVQRGGQSQTVRTVVKATWLGTDCGDVKPLQVPALQKPEPRPGSSTSKP